ncbi:MAG: MogA/MoaB family molybdenum cofactor biosynthesis protein [Deltaproteobacteria bacterium]|jgi:molybdenum cofactor biosynthesis protein B|nr:MogA/MoaB family molybdenum cofactor biosynthesis protein [Deltaproteobacteria bacterium]MBP6832699.1 MogA/MoaB family molybdenum cofactor biosynthesis protein [Deltaproteobacteria bacterium]
MAHQGAVTPRVATVTISDTRTAADDLGGELLGERLRAAGAVVVSHARVTDDPAAIRAAVELLLSAPQIDAVITTGGTGIAPRDQTIEALSPLLEKTLDGFGEAFRRLSWDQVGARSMLSRAVAGVARGRVLVLLPGSPKAVALAVDAVLAPVLGHMVALLRKAP